MKIKYLKIKNFRCFSEETKIDFENLTTFIGKNDAGKSTILEALDIFFNNSKGIIKLDENDINKTQQALQNNTVEITVAFSELPEKIILDKTIETNLEKEYLLNESKLLEIQKLYHKASQKPKILIHAYHPTNENCKDLLLKKQRDLTNIVKSLKIENINQNINSEMRSAIWNFYSNDLKLANTTIDVSEGEVKTIWTELEKSLPIYTLFQSDRKNSENDDEVQDPLKFAIKEVLKDDQLIKSLNEVAETVLNKLDDVSRRTLEKLQEMSPDVASQLKVNIPQVESLKWADVFKNISISDQNNISVNKRGSGVKRLILLNFFRAEAERKQREQAATSVIYAIEEPETSQHYENQRKLVKAFIDLSELQGNQVILTTHSSTIVKELSEENIRLVKRENGNEKVEKITLRVLPTPSLNEVNYFAFNDISTEYHNELYGYIDSEHRIKEFEEGQESLDYKRISPYDGKVHDEHRVLTHYIRDQIHHPENTLNRRFSMEELELSIKKMQDFIINKIKNSAFHINQIDQSRHNEMQ